MHSVWEAVWELPLNLFALNHGTLIPALARTATRQVSDASTVPHRDEVSAVSSSVVNEILDEDELEEDS
jgi:hypothetical protein